MGIRTSTFRGCRSRTGCTETTGPVPTAAGASRTWRRRRGWPSPWRASSPGSSTTPTTAGWTSFVSGYRLAPGDIAAEYLGEVQVAALPRLYRNRGDGTFRDVTRQAGLRRVLYTMGSNFGDLDNDGWLDAYIGTGTPDFRAIVPNRMFRNAEGGGFQEVTASSGFGHLGKGHGVAFGDLDQDGDQDLYVVIGGAAEGDVGRNVLWENPGFGNAWVTLRLEGVEANRSAIGARGRAGDPRAGGPLARFGTARPLSRPGRRARLPDP